MTIPTPLNDGGPAFPVGTKEIRIDTYGGGREESSYGWESGMTLRDYFAAKVSPEEVTWYEPVDVTACKKLLGLPNDAPWDGSRFMEIAQIIKYRIADAMLAARKAK